MIGHAIGLMPRLRIHGVIRHEQTGLLVDPKRGTIYGVAGTPVGAVCSDGYVRLGGGRNGYLYSHRVIYEVVHGEIPAGLEIDHINGRKADNRVCNLEAVTKAQTVQGAVALGLALKGEQKAHAKLTDALVREIRRTVGTVTHAECAQVGRRQTDHPPRARGQDLASRSASWPRPRKRKPAHFHPPQSSPKAKYRPASSS